MSAQQKRVRRGHGHGPGGGPGAGMMPGEKAKDFKGTLKQLLRYIGPYKRSVILAMIFTVAATAFNIISPIVLGTVTTHLYDCFTASISIDWTFIGNTLLVLSGLYLLCSGFLYLQGFLMSGISQRICKTLRTGMEQKLNRLPLRFFDTKTHGEILSRLTNDIDTVGQTLNQSMTQAIQACSTLIGILVMMFYISPLLTLVALCTLPLSFLFIRFIIKFSQKYFSGQQASLGDLNGHVEEMFSGHNVMKAYNGEQKSIEEFREYNEALYHNGWRAQFLSGLMMPIINCIGNLGYAAICVLGGYQVIAGRVSLGNIQAFLQYIRQFNQPVTETANIMNMLQSTAAAAERVFEFLAEEDQKPDAADAAQLKEVKGQIDFDHVVFGYDPEKVIIKDFSAHVKPGQTVAIVGPTGAGKTTLINLLMRFYELNAGSISVDGVDISQVTRESLRKNIGMVLQDTWLFSGTIRENIAYGRPSASDEQIIAAAKAAHVHHFIKTLPGGYNMPINEEGSNISAGQKQLLTIARAILSDPAVLILDEATSSIDTRTELLIQKALDSLMVGRTSFVIAHRLSTIKNADLILVLNEGNIVEQGTHEELLAHNGFYTKLYNSQFERAEAV